MKNHAESLSRASAPAAGERAKPRDDAQLDYYKDIFLHTLCCLVHMLFLSFSVCKNRAVLALSATVLEDLIHVCEVLSDLKSEGMRKHKMLL